MRTDTHISHSGLAGVCAATYSDEGLRFDELAALTRRRIITHRVLGISDIRATLIECDDRLVVAFRGTQFTNRRSTLRNLDTQRRDEQGRYGVHNGGADGLNDVYVKLIDALHEANDELKRDVTVTGHSQGGSLAEIFAVRLMAESFDKDSANIALRPKQIVTFAAPRSGDNRFAYLLQLLQHVGAQVVRYTNTNDLIPRVPLYTAGFRHGVTESYLNRKSKVVESPWFLYRLVDGVIDRFRTETFFDSVHGHSVQEYRRKLLEAGR